MLFRAIPITMLILSPSLNAMEPVEFDYMLNCQGCHLPDGSGNPQRAVPNFRDSLGKFLQVEGGREFLVQVPGAAMSDLSDEKLAILTNWMLNRFSPRELPPNFEPYTAAEVSALRVSPLIDVSGTRESLLEKIMLLDSQPLE